MENGIYTRREITIGLYEKDGLRWLELTYSEENMVEKSVRVKSKM